MRSCCRRWISFLLVVALLLPSVPIPSRAEAINTSGADNVDDLMEEDKDYTPSIVVQPEDASGEINSTIVLTVEAEPVADSTLLYQWYEVYANTNIAIEGETSNKFLPSTTDIGERHYYCVVSATVAEKEYAIESSVVCVNVGKNSESESITTLFDDYTPEITTQPADVVCEKDETVTLTVAATAPEGAALSYQWYEQLANGDVEIEGAKSETYAPSTEEVGERSYYCVVTNTFSGKAYTVQSANAKVTVEEVASTEVVTDLKIVAGNYSANSPTTYLDALAGNFDRSKTVYRDVIVTDVGYKVYIALSDEIKAMGNVSYDISYNGEVKKSGLLNNGVDGFMEPFSVVASYMTSGAETLIELQVGVKDQDGAYAISETYALYATLHRGLKKLSVMENGKNILTPASTTAANTLVDEFYGSIASGTENISMTINPTAKSATAYVGDTKFTSSSKATQIALDGYISEDGKSATIPVRLEWPATDSTQPVQVRNYTVHLTLVDYTPEITTQPADVVCKKDETVTLTVAATAPEGAALSYQWYEQLANGDVEIEGAKSETYAPSTEEVGERSYYCVVTNTFSGKVYTVQSANAKVTVGTWAVSPPKFIAQPSSVTCKQNDSISLSVDVEEPEAGTLLIQWFKNDVALRENGPTISVDTSEEGANAYYCRIDWYYNNETYHFFSQTAIVTVDNSYSGNNYTPVINRQPVNVICDKGDTPTLSVDVETPDEGVLSYQWYYQPNEKIANATSNVFVPQTNTSGQTYYYCVITNNVNGVRYSVQSEGAWVTVRLTRINVPTIVRDFGSYYKPSPKLNDETDYTTEYLEGVIPDNVYLTFEQSDSGVDYQLEAYHSITPLFENAERIEGAKSRKVRTYGDNGVVKREYYVNLNEGYKEGTHYFFCKVIASSKNDSSIPIESIVMGPVKIVFIKADVGFRGNGSQSDPYLLECEDDLVRLQQLVAEGQSFSGKYFHIVTDITLPSEWQPIGCTADGGTDIAGGANLRAFSGTIDGKIDADRNAVITVPVGGLPLLGYVNGATVRNLSIYGEQIKGAGLVNNYSGAGLNGNAIIIENVRLLQGTQTLKSGLIASTGGNGFACASAGFVVTIRNCVIESGVTIGYDGQESQIGSFAGRINGTIEDCTSSATVKGRSYVGGILGGRDNAMAQCVVRNSSFHGIVEASGTYAGGIVGGGYDNQTAPNGACPTIVACTVDGIVRGNERVGGIFGGDGFVAQTWDNVVGSISANSFTGKVSGNKYVGAIIGYRNSLNRYDNISANTYSAGCGADKGIGFVKYLDTSYSNPTKMDGTIVFSTEGTTKNCPAVEGCAWRKDHNRTDDPLGKDADKLCKKIGGSSADPICYELTVSGSYKTEYNLGEELNLNGIKLTATWTNGTTSTLSLGDVTIEGYDKNTVGNQTISLSYGAAVAYITVTVKPVSTKITVSVTIKGDSKHGTTSSPHGLARGGLTTWASESGVEADTSETVWDVLQRVAKKHNITFTASDNNSYHTVYISAVNGLGEFDNGNHSGWMYTVNGSHPEVGVAAKYLKNGDNIILHYTDDYDYEEGGNKYGQKPSGGTTTGGTTGTSMITTADRNKAAAVDKLIEKIGTVTKDSGPAIEAARKAYNDLTPTQKRLVTKLKELTDAENAYAKLTATAEDQKKAQEVMDKISKIGNVTKDSEQDIKDAREAYDALTDLQKKLVDNYDVLTAAETKLAMLKAMGKVSNPYITTGDYMEALGTPSVGSTGGEWMVIGLARSDRNVPGVENYYKKVLEYVAENIDPETGRLHKAKSTDNSRIIIALTAIGRDVTNVGGYDLLQGLSDLEFVKYQGNNGPIWALLALDSGNYPVPTGGTVTRQVLIDEILRVQTSDGGWTVSGDKADSDMTGMALTALAPYYTKDLKVQEAIDKAIARLSEMQDEDGGYSTSYDGTTKIATSESISQVVTALSALGINADTDPRFVKNGNSVIDALLRYYVKGGGFKHIMDGELDGMATEQAYYALTAYYRFLSGKTNLYDMTDIIDMGGDVVTVEPTVPAATEPAQANTPWWIIAVCIFGGVGWGIVIGVVLVPKLKKKD